MQLERWLRLNSKCFDLCDIEFSICTNITIIYNMCDNINVFLLSLCINVFPLSLLLLLLIVMLLYFICIDHCGK